MREVRLDSKPTGGSFLLTMVIGTFVAISASMFVGIEDAYAQDNPKIGVLNVRAALFSSEAAQSVQEELDDETEPDRERAEELQEQLEELQEEYQQNEAVMTDEEKRRANSDAQDLQVQLRLVVERLQQTIQVRQNQFLQEMGEEVAEAVSAVREEGEFDLILNADAVVHADNALEITAQVTAKLNEND